MSKMTRRICSSHSCEVNKNPQNKNTLNVATEQYDISINIRKRWKTPKHPEKQNKEKRNKQRNHNLINILVEKVKANYQLLHP